MFVCSLNHVGTGNCQGNRLRLWRLNVTTGRTDFFFANFSRIWRVPDRRIAQLIVTAI